MAKYDETENILELYLYAAGESEIPMTWHKWCCISMVASALADRVFYRKYAWKVLPPNMYIMLVGESGLGKGGAMDFGLQFRHHRMNLLYGSATKQAIIDRLSSTEEGDEVEKSKIFIVQDEMAEAVGTGQLADAYIKALTGWYSTSSLEIEENTRTHGRKIIESPICINWLAGTTNEWLRDCVDYKAMMSGFFGRVCTVPAGYVDFNERIYTPTIVRDYDQVSVYLKARFEELTYLEGEFGMLPAAREIDQDWYENRPEPSEDMRAFWRREHALILKLAMILSACDSLDRIIHPRHIVQAQDLVKEVRTYMPKVISLAAHGGMLAYVDKVKEKIFNTKAGISRTNLLKWAWKYNIKARELDELVSALRQREDIKEFRQYGKTWYQINDKPPINWGEINY